MQKPAKVSDIKKADRDAVIWYQISLMVKTDFHMDTNTNSHRGRHFPNNKCNKWICHRDKKQKTKTKTNQKPTNHLCPSQTHNQQSRKTHCQTLTRGGAHVPPPQLIHLHLHSVLYQKIWPLRWQMSWGHVECGAPVASSHRQHKRGLCTSSWESGTVCIQGTGHHLRYTNTTAYFRRLERVSSLSFKTFTVFFFIFHHICTHTQINVRPLLGWHLGPRRTNICQLMINTDNVTSRDMLRIPHEHHEASTAI